MTISTRLLQPDDVAVLAALLRANRAYLAPWEPLRDDNYFTDGGHGVIVGGLLEQYARGFTVPHLILDGDRVVGRITLNAVARGPFQSCSLGYWVAQADTGRGVASAAVRCLLAVAFDELGLHRVQAGVIPSNTGSQRVLERNGFVQFGRAPRYLNIAGQWQDHLLYQLLADDRG